MVARTIVALALIAVTAGAARAGSLASLAEDVDGDGTPDAIELGDDGVVRIAGTPSGAVRIAATATSGKLAVTRYRGATYVVVQIATAAISSAAPAREAVILRADAGTWHEVVRFALGGIGLDHDYGIEVDATRDGIYRFQSRDDIRRCDGKPVYLFAEKFDGARFRRASALPSQVPEAVPLLAATLDVGRPPPPLLYRAHAASHEVGVSDAGGLTIPRELDDGRLDTVWREELVASAGDGQLFTFEPRVASAQAGQLRIVPGNPASSATIRSFNRPHKLAIVTANAAWRVALPDAASGPPGAAYTVELPHPVTGCLTVVLESSYGAPQGTTAIAELEVYAAGERTDGGDALLARAVVVGGAGATAAASALAHRGTTGAAALEAALAATTDPGARRRLIGALAHISDPAVAPMLARAAAQAWVRDQDLLEVIAALGALGDAETLRALASDATLPVAARVAAIARIPVVATPAVGARPGPSSLAVLGELADAVARPSATAISDSERALRRAVIERASREPVPALLAAAAAHANPAAAGDLWRAAARAARAAPDQRAAAVVAMRAALATAPDYERRYRLVDAIAALGDATALRALAALLAGWPAGAQTAALRQVAVRAIASAPRGEAIELVLALARDADPGVRLAALAALASDGPARSPEAAGNPAETSTAIDDAVARAIGDDPWPEVRRRAAVTLAQRCHRPGPARVLASAVERDRDLGVRGDALSALVQCRAPAVGALLARLWDDARAPLELRLRAVLEATALADPALAAVLVERFTQWRGAVTSSAPALALAQAAAATIGRLAAPGAARALTEALDDAAFPELVEAAALGLGALGPACPAEARRRLAELAHSDDQTAVAARRAVAQCGK
jgi:hypothetical protein